MTVSMALTIGQPYFILGCLIELLPLFQPVSCAAIPVLPHVRPAHPYALFTFVQHIHVLDTLFVQHIHVLDAVCPDINVLTQVCRRAVFGARAGDRVGDPPWVSGRASVCPPARQAMLRPM